jgi:D-serine deaminase-like pyridoxal phosphate-dependent protein
MDELDTPALVIDLPRLKANVEAMARIAREAGVALRPHAKTHKMVEVAALQLDAGAAGLTVAKLGEAEVFAGGGCEDLLIAYPLVGGAKLERLAALARRARVAVALDSLEVARAIAESGADVAVRIEVDTGQHRAGVLPRDVAALARDVAGLGLRVEGVMTHEGHAYGEQDLAAATHEVAAMMARAGAEIAAAAGDDAARAPFSGAAPGGRAAPIVSLGSTPTARFAAREDGVTEIRPGTYVFQDRTQVAHGAAVPEDLAATVLATVVSRPAPDRAGGDAGTKVLSSDRLNAPGAPPDFGALAGTGWPLVRASEEHGVVELPPEADLQVGDRVQIVPNHVCPVVNLFDEAAVVEDGEVVARWRVAARGLSR